MLTSLITLTRLVRHFDSMYTTYVSGTVPTVPEHLAIPVHSFGLPSILPEGTANRGRQLCHGMSWKPSKH